jgi:hypothetical protein
MMSATAVDFIAERLVRGRDMKRHVVEYGSGASTLYFTRLLAAHRVPCVFTAVERNIDWYTKVCAGLSAVVYERNEWGMASYLAYLVRPTGRREMPRECRRLPWQKWRMLKRMPIHVIRRDSLRYFCDMRARAEVGTVTADYCYVYEGFKDQFGESPNKTIYIDLPLQKLLGDCISGEPVWAGVVVDGGPRGDIVERILTLADHYANLHVEIFLLEAGRPLYTPILASRPGGRFIGAQDNVRIDGRVYLSPPAAGVGSRCQQLMTVGDLDRALGTELWYYSNV